MGSRMGNSNSFPEYLSNHFLDICRIINSWVDKKANDDEKKKDEEASTVVPQR